MAGPPVGSLRVDLTANTASFEQGLRRAAGTAAQFEQGMRRATAVSGQYRAGMQQLGFQINDVAAQMATGTRATVIFAQQSSQFVQAIQLMSGGTSRFAAFLGGPWGIAITAGSAILVPLIARMLDTRTEMQRAIDAIAEHARQTDLNREAQQAYARTLPGVIAAIRDQTAALQEQNRTMAENRQAALDTAQSNLAIVQGLRGRLLTEWARLTTEVENAQRAVIAVQNNPDRDAARLRADAEAHLADMRAQLNAVQSQIAQANAAITAGEQAVSRARVPFVEAQARARSDPEFRINEHYDDLVRSARERAIAERTVETTLAAQLDLLDRQRKAALDAIRDVSRASRAVGDPRELVRPVTGAVLSQFGADRSGVPLNGRRIAGRRHEGVDLRGALGDPVVAPEGGVARVLNAPGGLGLYVEIRADSGARNLLGHLSAANVRSGDRVSAGQLVGLVGNSGNAAGGPPHLHWQRQVNGRWVDPMGSVGSSGAAQEAQAAAREAAQLAERRQRDEEHFQEELSGLNTDILNARRRQVQTEEEAAADDITAIRGEQAERDQRIRNEAADRARRDASQAVAANIEAGLLLAKSQELAQTRIDARNALMRQRLDEQRIEIAQRDLNDQESVLQARAQLARTAMERRDIELRLLALQHQEELLAIQKQRAQQGVSPDRLAQLDRQEVASNARYGLNRQNTLRQTAGPLEAFMNELPRSAAELNEALQSIAAEGLKSISDGLVDVITGARKMGDVFKNVVASIISDLLRIQIQRAIIGPLANALSGLFGGGGGLSKLDAGTLGWANPFGGARAAGGPVLPGRTYLVGEKGPELLRMGPTGGHVIANDNIGGGGRALTINQTYTFQGVAVTQDEFVRGLMAAKMDTIRTIKQEGRRRA